MPCQWHVIYSLLHHTTPYNAIPNNTALHLNIPQNPITYYAIQNLTSPYHTYYTIPHNTIPHHAITTPYHVIQCHNHTSSCRLPYHSESYHTIRYNAIQNHAITMPYSSIPYNTIPYHTRSCHDYAIPYHTIPNNAATTPTTSSAVPDHTKIRNVLHLLSFSSQF